MQGGGRHLELNIAIGLSIANGSAHPRMPAKLAMLTIKLNANLVS